MAQASLTAQICDLLGEHPDAGAPERPTVAEALAGCARGQVTAARDGDRDVAVVVLADGRSFVLEDRCPHDGGPLSDGFVEDGAVVCARHGWEIDPCSGRCPRRQSAGAIATRLVALGR